ncbi:MAG TPA: hypothetical protein VKI44_07705 [Acetobacteraceae bacterium]|nr:hypothetical protein [Acetobacteraceae bacterium]
MIKATGSVGALQLSIDGRPIGVLDHAKLGFTLNGQTYTVRRKGGLAPVYELLRDNEPLLSIRQTPFLNRYTVTTADRKWTLKAEEMFAKRFGLFDGNARVGGIAPSSRFNYTRDITIDLPDVLPLEAQVFLMWLLLWKWGAPSS